MNNGPRFEPDDAVVLLLGAPSDVPSLRGRIEGITRLEKLLFLLERETSVGQLLTEPLDYEPYKFGPFSASVYQAVDTLAAAGLITDSTRIASSTDDSWEASTLVNDDRETTDPYATRDFSLTEKGVRYYDALTRELPSALPATVGALKSQFGSLPLRHLIRYVYKKYPAFTGESIIRDKVL